MLYKPLILQNIRGFVYISESIRIYGRKMAISEVFAKGKQVRKYDVFCDKPPLLGVISAQKSKKITKCV